MTSWGLKTIYCLNICSLVKTNKLILFNYFSENAYCSYRIVFSFLKSTNCAIKTKSLRNYFVLECFILEYYFLLKIDFFQTTDFDNSFPSPNSSQILPQNPVLFSQTHFFYGISHNLTQFFKASFIIAFDYC